MVFGIWYNVGMKKNLKKTGYKDKNGVEICLGDLCRTYDKTGKEWVAPIKLRKGVKIGDGKLRDVVVFASNYDTWVHHYWSEELEIIGKWIKVKKIGNFIRRGLKVRKWNFSGRETGTLKFKYCMWLKR